MYGKEIMNNNFDIYALRGITENPVILDFSKCKYLGEIHLMLKEKFGFHNFYGENWDALWDLMQDVFCENKEYSVELHGFYSMDKELQDECRLMLKVFDDVHNETPNFTYKIIS